jgi:hypothetical protein
MDKQKLDNGMADRQQTTNPPQTQSHIGVCPHCGYCPTCGRPYGNFNYPQFPYYPLQPVVWCQSGGTH